MRTSSSWKEKFIRSLVNACIIFVIISIPFKPQLGNVFLLLLLTLAILHASLVKQAAEFPRFFYLLFFAYAVRILWAIPEDDPTYALKCLETESTLLLIPFAFSFVNLSYYEKTRHLIIYVVVGFFIMLYSFIQLMIYIYHSPYDFAGYLLIHLSKGEVFWGNMMNWKFGHYSFMGMAILYGLHVLVFLPETRRIAYARIFYLICLVIFIILTGWRGGGAILIFSIALYFIILSGAIMKKSIMAIIFIGAVILGFWMLENYKTIDKQRYEYGKVAIDFFKKKPLFGYGTGAQKEYFKKFNRNDLQPPLEVNHPHNQYLTELLQFGIIGSSPFFLFLVTGFYYAFKKRFWSLLCVISTSSIFMLIESPINSNKGGLPLILIIALLVINPKVAGRSDSFPEKR